MERTQTGSRPHPRQRRLANAVLAAAYVVMALGLNIIVGFAGLLDLGYVAFFAIGAYTVGYFASGFHSSAGNDEGIHVAVAGQAANLPGIHFNFLLVLILAVIACTIAGMLIGLPTLRLRVAGGPKTLYLVPSAVMTTPSQSALTTYIAARRVLP